VKLLVTRRIVYGDEALARNLDGLKFGTYTIRPFLRGLFMRGPPSCICAFLKAVKPTAANKAAADDIIQYIRIRLRAVCN
jgi:hypothetical protein